MINVEIVGKGPHHLELENLEHILGLGVAYIDPMLREGS